MKHESTGSARFQLMFGRKPKLAIDTMFQIDNNLSFQIIRRIYNQKWTQPDQLPTNIWILARGKQKRLFDRKARAAALDVGDRFGPDKLADKYEQDVYKIVLKPHTDMPVYVVESPDGRQRKLHCNQLLPVSPEGECEPYKEPVLTTGPSKEPALNTCPSDESVLSTDPIKTRLPEQRARRPVPKPRGLARKEGEDRGGRKCVKSSHSEEETVVVSRRYIERPAGKSEVE